MGGSITLGIAALLTLLPAALLPFGRRDASAQHSGFLFWVLLLVATIGPLALDVSVAGGIWRTGFSATLWTIIAATMFIYLIICALSEAARRLSGLLLPYLVLLALIALAWSSVPAPALPGSLLTAWLQVHIGVSLVTYGLISIAAVAALAIWLKERALRAHRVSGWSEILPAVADAEHLQIRLLIAAEIVLGAGLLTGVATELSMSGAIFEFDHKTILSVATFVIIGILLLLNRGSGLRGRRAARIVLFAYLLITLAFPGVKFVTEVIVG
ncbi:MAG: cytochrome c biogenesis protein CcsA [Proteobacteria bacterium]|nr:cytochrome c biogenesis protein CcsA [Pseudomonadota bacterium]